MFSGIWIPLITPFHDDKVDTAALRRLVRHYQGAGVAGFVALGTSCSHRSSATPCWRPSPRHATAVRPT